MRTQRVGQAAADGHGGGQQEHQRCLEPQHGGGVEPRRELILQLLLRALRGGGGSRRAACGRRRLRGQSPYLHGYRRQRAAARNEASSCSGSGARAASDDLGQLFEP